MGLILSFLPRLASLARRLPWWAWALAACLAWGSYQRHRAQAAVARCEAQQAEQQRAAQEQLAAERQQAQAAATAYETQRVAIARRAATPSPESRYALHATICPPAGPLGRSLELGDVPVPGPVLDRLRAAGADEAPR